MACRRGDRTSWWLINVIMVGHHGRGGRFRDDHGRRVRCGRGTYGGRSSCWECDEDDCG